MSVPKVFVKKRRSKAGVTRLLSRDEKEESNAEVDDFHINTLTPTLLIKKHSVKQPKQPAV
jgi:hypothetical protein